MKTTYKSLLAVFIYLTACIGFAQAQELKVATIDMKIIIDGYYKTKDLYVAIDKKQVAIQQEDQKRSVIIADVKKKIEKLRMQGADSSLSKAQREKIKKEFDKYVDEYNQRERARKEDLGVKSRVVVSERNKGASEILQEISTVIQDYSVKEGYDYVFNKVGKEATVTNVVFRKIHLLNKPLN